MTLASLRTFLSELRRRRVFGVAGVYLVLAYGAVEVADLFVPALGLPRGLITAVAVTALAGFPVALALGWVFDLTGGGLRRTPDADRGDADTTTDGPGAPGQPGAPGRPAAPRQAASPARLLAGGAGVGAVIALVTVGALSTAGRAGWGSGRGAEAPRDPSSIEAIAVLPFADRSRTGDDTYFSDGLTEELLNALARRGDVRVAGRSSSFRYRGDGVDVREVGRALGVQAVLEGSVQRDGRRLRVTAQLTDAETGYTLWADAYDRELTDVFAVQEELARRILTALDRAPEDDDVVVRPGTADLAAYDRFLRGNHLLRERTLEATLRAIDEYRAAAELDPDFAAALHRQGYAHVLIADWGWELPGASPREVIERAAALIDRALVLDDASSEAWLARAYLRTVQDPYRMADALPAFARAIAIEPDNAEMRHQHAQALTALGRFDEAMAEYHRVLEIEPDRAMAMVPMAAIRVTRGDTAGALAWADSAVVSEPGNAYARAYRGMVALLDGDTAKAIGDVRTAHRIAGSAHKVPVRGALASVLALTGSREEARMHLASARSAAAPDGLSPTEALYLAGAALALGARDRALADLEAAEPRGAWLWFYLQGPGFDPLREEPRFRAVEAAADPRGVTAELVAEGQAR